MGFFSRLRNIGRGLWSNHASDAPSFSTEMEAALDAELARGVRSGRTTPLSSKGGKGNLGGRGTLRSLEQRYQRGELTAEEYARKHADLVLGADTPASPAPERADATAEEGPIKKRL